MNKLKNLKFVPNRDACPRNTWGEGDYAYGWYCAQDPDGSWYWYKWPPTFNVDKRKWEEKTSAFPKRYFYKKTDVEDCIYDTCVYMGTMEQVDDLNKRLRIRLLDQYDRFYNSKKEN